MKTLLSAPRYLLLAALVVAVPLQLSAQSWRLASVQIEGSDQLPPAEVAEVSGLVIGNPTSLDDIKNATEQLSQLGLFEFVSYRYQTTPNTITVVFVVEESASFYECDFDNFVWHSRDELLARLQEEIPLFSGKSPPAGYLIDEIKRVLQDILEELDVPGKVTHLPPFSKEGGVNIFRVDGVSMPVTSIRFEGAEAISQKALQKASRPLLSRDFSTDFLKTFANYNLISLYRSKGYLQVKFDKPQVQFLGEAEGTYPVILTFALTEGPQYRFGSITWQGNQALTSEELTGHINFKPGKIADAVKVANKLNLLRAKEYGSRGFLQAKLTTRWTTHESESVADLIVEVEEGGQYHFEKLVLQGFPEGIQGRIQDRWKLQPGDPFDAVYFRDFVKKQVRPLLSQAPRRGLVRNLINRNDENKTVIAILRFQ